MSKTIIEQINGNGSKPNQQPKPQRQTAPMATSGQLPAMSKVLQQNAIATTQASIEQVQLLSQKRTEVVLQAFDHYMDESDAAIVEGLKDRLGSRSLDFFAAVPVEAGEDAIDLNAAFAELVTWAKPDSTEAIAPTAVEVLTTESSEKPSPSPVV
jgi:hypothetical protein